MKIVESSVSAGGRPVFDLDEFLSRPLYAHLAHSSEHGAHESPSGSTGTAKPSGSSAARLSRPT